MNDWFYLLLIPVLLLLIWFWPATVQHSRRDRQRANQSAATANRRQFHAVSIEAGSHACSAVLALKGKRFLAHQVMGLPVDGCDAAACRCTYRHYADRRSGEERRRASVAMKQFFNRDEHRNGADRRKSHLYS